MNNTQNKETGSYTDLIGKEFRRVERVGEKVKREIWTGKTPQKLFKELLAQIKPVDFREKAELDKDAKVSRKVHIVLSVDEIVETAVANAWGLCTKNGFIYVYNSKYWKKIDPEDFKLFLARAALKMGVPVLEAKYYQFRDELYKQFLATAILPTPEPDDSIRINLLNGTFVITEQEQVLVEPQPEDFITYQLPFKYDPEAKCPMFDRYLVRVLPDESCRMVLAEFLGHIFIKTSILKLEKVLLLYGSGANGKSVLFDIVNAMLGEENVSFFSLQSLTKTEGYNRAELSNKLLNYASEISSKLETSSIFKQLASGEPVEARQIYGKPFIMQNYAKLMFNTNELPRDVEQNHAFFRRLTILPCTQTIPESEQDPELAKKIIASELSGIFNWVLDGLRRVLKQRKFTESAVIKEQVENYRRESDSVAMFLDEEGYAPATEEHVALKDMYWEYQDYCRDNGHRPYSNRNMSDRLRKYGYDIKKIAQGRIVYAKK